MGLLPGGGRRESNRNEPAIAVQTLDLNHHRAAAAHSLVQLAGGLLVRLGHEQVGEELTQYLVRLITEQALEGGVHAEHPSLRADCGDGVGRAVHQRVEKGAVTLRIGLPHRDPGGDLEALQQRRVRAPKQHDHSCRVRRDQRECDELEPALPAHHDRQPERHQQHAGESVETLGIAYECDGRPCHESREHHYEESQILRRECRRDDHRR